MSQLRWKCFKTEKPYDAYEDIKDGLETDYEFCWFTYRYTDRPGLVETNNFFLSYKACMFKNGLFEGYEPGMSTSPYPTDWIEVLTWCSDQEVRDLILEEITNATM